MCDGSVRNGFGLSQIIRVAGDLIQIGQAAEDDTLIVGPRGLAVVPTIAGQAVINQILGVNHAAVMEPEPLIGGPVKVTSRSAVTGCPLMQLDGQQQEE